MVDIPDIGHKVQIEVNGHNGKTSHEGIILHPASKGHLTIKLVNGYNASYPVEDIESLTVVGKMAEVEPPDHSQVEFKKGLPRVRIIPTGGTIASNVD